MVVRCITALTGMCTNKSRDGGVGKHYDMYQMDMEGNNGWGEGVNHYHLSTMLSK